MLKRINRRKQLIIELTKYFSVTSDDLFEIDYNDKTVNKLFSMLKDLVVYKELEAISLAKKTEEAIGEIIAYSKLKGFYNESYFALFTRETEIEAVNINTHQIKKYLKELLELVNFSNGFGDFVLFSQDLTFVYCIEQRENKNVLKIFSGEKH